MSSYHKTEVIKNILTLFQKKNASIRNNILKVQKHNQDK